ncbi:ribosome biogenesis protein NOP53 [Pectinophora gossypiella]|uniref:ribosome biogenesis protein NOP53 n=1 Tax=Pectinophora gossypiella TaxID=13191 RepID=UPI00214EA2E0|nr:ribosome biogenesis protein NOP53 [Pectinophora gossypiella]
MSVVKKKKHVSKKNKKAWRKYCDIRDVEEFLEDQRLEERLGKFETKPDSELFVVDTEGDSKVKDVEEKPLNAKQKKRKTLPATPKCFEVLLPTSKVPDPNANRNHVNPVGSKRTALSKLTNKRRFEKGVLQKKVEVAQKNRKLAIEKKRKAKQTRQNFNLDLWGNDLPETKGIPASLCDEFISPEAQLHNVLPDRRLRPKPPLAKTVVTRSAVEAPHPGVSYNPSFKEHQELLQEVVQHEQKMMKREAHLHRVTTGMFSKVTQQQKENQWREEMSVGLPQPHNPTNDEPESDTDNEYKAVNPPVKNKKKDHKARRKQRERLDELERIKREKIDKKKITDLYRLRKIKSSIKKKEELNEKLRSKRVSKKAEEAKTSVPVLNAHKPPRKEPEFVDPKQLTGDLRHVSSTTNLLRDRYESLQRRGAVAASKLMMKKKRKLKSYFKAGHKVTEQEIERYTTRSAGKK